MPSSQHCLQLFSKAYPQGYPRVAGDQPGVLPNIFLPLSLAAKGCFSCRSYSTGLFTGCGFQSVPKITTAWGPLGKFHPFSGHQVLDLNMAGVDCVTNKALSVL